MSHNIIARRLKTCTPYELCNHVVTLKLLVRIFGSASCELSDHVITLKFLVRTCCASCELMIILEFLGGLVVPLVNCVIT